ncbi:MAG: hypothetical protein ABSE39_08705 [Candidatus Bathyarchaeia archaeon]|jgi:hypothetical protein
MEKVLTELVGAKVSRVIMKKVAIELHEQPTAPFLQVPALRVGAEQVPAF